MNIIVNGAAGRMGQQVCRLLAEQGHTLAAAVDRSGGEGFYAALADYTGPADVVVDFSFHEGVGELVDYCVGRRASGRMRNTSLAAPASTSASPTKSASTPCAWATWWGSTR